GRLEKSLHGARLSVFRSNGGVLSARAAAAEPVQTLLSGPAAGVMGAWKWGRSAGLGRLVTLDMGGTSTDVALLDGAPVWTTEAIIGGHPVRLPLMDIHTVGAGGGSLAHKDSGGALVVGPESAGADPGPACYGKGDRPTVTDAHLVLGRLPADRLLGGRQPLERDRGASALARLGDQLGLGLQAVAAGVVRVANAGMERAVRVVSVQRGHDPRDFALFCFGGAGGLHAAELAEGLGMQEVVIPPDAGVFSAAGMLMAPPAKDAVQGVLVPLQEMPRVQREKVARRLEERLLADLEAEGYGRDRVKLERSLDLRYRGQSFELNVSEGEDPEAAFHHLHRRRFAHQRPGVPLELVAIRVRAVGPVEGEVDMEAQAEGSVPIPGAGNERSESADSAHPPAGSVVGRENAAPVEGLREERPAGRPVRRSQVCFQGGICETEVMEREDLPSDRPLAGPCIITEPGSTTLVPPGWRLRVDVSGNLRLTREPVR
ncbi:MAG: hydantoinase/oxoprolinase family protein, partial [Acidobacteriota bacterium]